MTKTLICIFVYIGFQHAYSMDIESFESFSNADKNSFEYSAARLWIDGLIGGVITMKSAYKTPNETPSSYPGLSGEQICFPKNRPMADVLMEAGRREASENGKLYYASKLGKKFPMETVVWTGMARFFPCQKVSTN